jgi:acetyl-CoA C-acetyltransferase
VTVPFTPTVAVAGHARTPFGKFAGSLRSLTLPELGTLSVVAALEDADIGAERVDEMVVGVNFPGGDRSIARQVQLRAGVPDDRVSYTVDRACCSSLAAIAAASRSIRLGDAQVVVAGGVENLSQVPYFIKEVRFGKKQGDIALTDQLVVSCPHTGVARAVQASTEAAAYGIGREEQDEWACRSQARYAEARARGFFAREVVAVDTTDGTGRAVSLEADECPRPGTTMEGLRRLSPVNGSETVTAGNAPDLSSGAAMLVLTKEEAAGVRPLAWIGGWAAAAGEPQHIASMPAAAAQLALNRTGLTLDDVDLIEINEAFAAVPLVSTLVLADGDPARAAGLRSRTNINGGSVAIGHPTGATAARMVMTAVSALTERGGGTALVTICGGIGEAEALLVFVDERGPGPGNRATS